MTDLTATAEAVLAAARKIGRRAASEAMPIIAGASLNTGYGRI